MSLQSQTHSNNELLGSEGEPESAIGREKEYDLIFSPKEKVHKFQLTKHMKHNLSNKKNWDCSHISREIRLGVENAGCSSMKGGSVRILLHPNRLRERQPNLHLKVLIQVVRWRYESARGEAIEGHRERKQE
ncbi:uncharacterized protein LOC123684307 [Harmonia axyridis]|uniref:uncharacterized protein LOC123684307 n=1 Tax=Harmonia axyridis TaxID=115357 RepID=UPI001E274DE5|nr:uncharacterized protein LOC123684307 [Harmonia axyridis]